MKKDGCQTTDYASQAMKQGHKPVAVAIKLNARRDPALLQAPQHLAIGHFVFLPLHASKVKMFKLILCFSSANFIKFFRL